VSLPLVILLRGNVSLVIVPRAAVSFESSLEQRLIHYENQLIRAQSMAGFLSTLGGGFFMCHHWRTAVAMAQQQQQMARVLGDLNMYFKCLVNQAYNFIYAGKFQPAKELLQHILIAVEKERPSDADILINMVDSALLFRKRVRRFAKLQSIAAQGGQNQATDKVYASHAKASQRTKTMDDFRRIRVVKDESSAEDLVRAFHLRAM
jgi:hypothetical protein